MYVTIQAVLKKDSIGSGLQGELEGVAGEVQGSKAITGAPVPFLSADTKGPK